jgi:hypothetical protein
MSRRTKLLLLFGPPLVAVPAALAWAVVDHYFGPFGTRHAW